METQTKLNKYDFRERMGKWFKWFEPLFNDGDIMEELFMKLKEIGLTKTICPDSKNTFRSFQTMDPEKLKVIFVLLDPYPSIKNKIKVSNGIAMDCSNTEILQPSLEKFYQGIENEYSDGLELNMVKSPSLEWLINQGVMFFNTALTVEANKTGSHTELWRDFMHYFYEEVMSNFTGIIYVLCGKESQKMEKWINPLANYIIKIEHPSFAARQYREWNTEGAFKKINYILRSNNGNDSQINWINLGEEGLPF